MLEQLANRLAGAQARLRAALIDGVDTKPFRAAVEQIETDIAAEHERKRQAMTEQAHGRAVTINRRAQELAGATSQRIAAALKRFPLPSHP